MSEGTTDDPDLLTRLMAENWVHAHRSEDRRIVITAVNSVAATAILIALAFSLPSSASLFLRAWLLCIGLYGFLACLKLHERAAFHTLRARHLRTRLIELLPDSRIQQIHDAVEQTHRGHYRYLSALRLNSLFLTLHVVMVAVAIIYLAVAVIH